MIPARISGSMNFTKMAHTHPTSPLWTSYFLTSPRTCYRSIFCCREENGLMPTPHQIKGVLQYYRLDLAPAGAYEQRQVAELQSSRESEREGRVVSEFNSFFHSLVAAFDRFTPHFFSGATSLSVCLQSECLTKSIRHHRGYRGSHRGSFLIVQLAAEQKSLCRAPFLLHIPFMTLSPGCFL